jgi:hypothetical protein
MVITQTNIDMKKENWIESLGYLVQRRWKSKDNSRRNENNTFIAK